ncbi:MAG: hypothetical protein DRI65_02310 [Chloroflexota bacterium]|nr:MAG: hypothetical protein DRI65_02310 [Chloroflexota bacterium]
MSFNKILVLIHKLLKLFKMKPHVVEAAQISPNSYMLVYEVGIPSEYLTDTKIDSTTDNINDLFIQTAYAGSDAHEGCDSTSGVCAKVWLYYVDYGGYGYYNYMLTKWTRYDSTISWSNAYMAAACAAVWYEGGGRCLSTQNRYIGTPGNGYMYSHYPSFRGPSNKVYLNDMNGLAAFQYITLKRGVNTWYFSFCVNYQGSVPIPGCH